MKPDSGSGARNRRDFLASSAKAGLGAILVPQGMPCALASWTPGQAEALDAARSAVERLLGAAAAQFHLQMLPPSAQERFRISSSAGRIVVGGTSPSAVCMGVNWYLKREAGVSVSWNGDCLNRLPARLPRPTKITERRASGVHRFALNDTNDGYTGPYWSWTQWERLIDVLALHGINEVLVYLGAEAVYQQTMARFGFSAEEIRRWLPTPAHQPWWLLQNMSGWVGPSMPQHLIDSRAALAVRICARLRELGMTPVLPGYYGTVMDGFAAKNPGARILPQGTWVGMKRPDMLDPTTDLFAEVAQRFYAAQQSLLGPSTMFKMDPFHEGGQTDGLNLTDAGRSIDGALQKAHPGATWAILGWNDNPKRALLDGVANRERMLVLDGLSDRDDTFNREQDWDNTPYCFGTIWNFGGHTTMGANLGVWNQRYFDALGKTGSRLSGIAIMPEASCNNPAAFAFFTELAWRQERPDIPAWFAEWTRYRYGGQDDDAAAAWSTLQRTAYDMPSGKWSEAHDNLFSAQPSFTAKSACSWGPQEPRYDLALFRAAIPRLLQVRSDLRNSTAYRYDLADVARQTIANYSRILLPKIHAAFTAKDATDFRQLSQTWLAMIDLLDAVVATNPAFDLGSWVAAAGQSGRTDAERAEMEFDARSLLLEWGPPSSADSGVHDYANREWHGLLAFYRMRWTRYFDTLAAALAQDKEPETIDWFAMDQDWSRNAPPVAAIPAGDPYATIANAMRRFTETTART